MCFKCSWYIQPKMPLFFFDSEKLIPLARLYSNDRDGSDTELKQFTKVLNTMDVREKRQLLH